MELKKSAANLALGIDGKIYRGAHVPDEYLMLMLISIKGVTFTTLLINNSLAVFNFNNANAKIKTHNIILDDSNASDIKTKKFLVIVNNTVTAFDSIKKIAEVYPKDKLPTLNRFFIISLESDSYITGDMIVNNNLQPIKTRAIRKRYVI